MKRFCSFAFLALLMLAAVFMAGCAATAAEQSAEPDVSAQEEVPKAAEEAAGPSEQPSAAKAALPADSSWTVAVDTKITHPTNITGFLNEEFGITVGFSGEIHYTNDAGQNWPDAENSSMCRFCLDIVDENVAWTGGNGDMVRVTHDGGKTWTAVTDIRLDAGHANIDFVDDTTGWIASQFKLAATKDGGETWTEMPLPEGAESICAISLRTPEDGYLLSREGLLYITGDGGATWSGQDLGLKSYDIVDMQKQPKLGKSNMAVADLSFTDEENGTVVLTGMSSGGGFVIWCLTTGDGGATWESEKIPDLGYSITKVFLTADGQYLTLASNNNQTVLLKRQS